MTDVDKMFATIDARITRDIGEQAAQLLKDNKARIAELEEENAKLIMERTAFEGRMVEAEAENERLYRRITGLQTELREAINDAMREGES